MFLAARAQIFCDSRLLNNEDIWQSLLTNKHESINNLINDLKSGMTHDFILNNAPAIWWHPTEKYKASDASELLQTTEIQFRELNYYIPFITSEFVNLGPFKNPDFKSINYNGYTPLDEVTRLLENKGIKNGFAGFELKYDADQILKQPAPLYWRLSQHPLFEKIQNSSPDELFLPIEYWYHHAYNYTGIYFGNHDGDWESTLYLFKAKFINNQIEFIPIMISTSAHGGSTWHCPESLNKIDSRFELYSAVGTHATYTRAGYHWRFIYPDRTAKGELWQAWKLVKPLVKEDFFGFSGSWGKTSFIYFQNAPIPPGPKFKYLPTEMNADSALADYLKARNSCI